MDAYDENTNSIDIFYTHVKNKCYTVLSKQAKTVS